MRIMTNIRGSEMKGLHDCFDCKGCMFEKICKEYEEEEFDRKKVKNIECEVRNSDRRTVDKNK